MTDASSRPILVAGATGRQGGSVARHLLERQLTVRALVRDPQSGRAKALAGQGIEIAQGDMDDLASLQKAMAGARGVYSVQDYFTVGAAREVQEGKNMADAALGAGVEHFVFSSVGGAERKSGIAHFETKWEIENHIRKLGLPATMIRPAGFMENYFIPQLEKQLVKGRLFNPLRSDRRLQTIASDDIGKFISLAFAQPDRFIGLELEIAGSELTGPETADVFSRRQRATWARARRDGNIWVTELYHGCGRSGRLWARQMTWCWRRLGTGIAGRSSGCWRRGPGRCTSWRPGCRSAVRRCHGTCGC